MTLNISHNFDCYYKVDNWNKASLYAQNHLTPLSSLTFSKISNIKPTSEKIIVFSIERLFFVDVLSEIQDLIYECYDKRITFVLDASIDDISETDSKKIEKSLSNISYLFDEKYFKILVSYNKLTINKKWVKYFVHLNYWALHCVHNLNDFSIRPKRDYLFSMMIGRILREERLYFVNELFRRDLKDEQFFTCAPPIQLDTLTLLDRHSNSFDNGIWESSRPLIEKSILEVKNWNVDDYRLTNGWTNEQKEYFKLNINKILNHPFVDIRGNQTTFAELRNSNIENYIEHSHWDKIIPPQIYNSWINVVPEGIQPYLSEKTYKPIVAGVPFIISCIKNSDTLLKELGFEPYYDLFNYIMPDDMLKRIDFIVDQLLLLREDNHVQKLLKQQLPIIKHNQEQLKKIANDFSYMKEI